MKDNQPKPAVLPTEIPKKEEKAPAQRLVVIEFDRGQARIIKSDCSSIFELKGILRDLLAAAEKV